MFHNTSIVSGLFVMGFTEADFREMRRYLRERFTFPNWMI